MRHPCPARAPTDSEQLPVHPWKAQITIFCTGDKSPFLPRSERGNFSQGEIKIRILGYLYNRKRAAAYTIEESKYPLTGIHPFQKISGRSVFVISINKR
jgi:hypothetical protein